MLPPGHYHPVHLHLSTEHLWTLAFAPLPYGILGMLPGGGHQILHHERWYPPPSPATFEPLSHGHVLMLREVQSHIHLPQNSRRLHDLGVSVPLPDDRCGMRPEGRFRTIHHM